MTQKDKICTALQVGAHTVKELHAMLQIPSASIRRCLAGLEKAGHITSRLSGETGRGVEYVRYEHDA
jgi:predicted HTH transcriptional regulator